MHITRISGFGIVVQGDQDRLFVDDLALDFEHTYGDYRYSEQLAGARHFSLMPLAQLADSLFGAPVWPTERPVPQAWIEFEVTDVEAATEELAARGIELLVSARQEPWGQVLTRFLAANGMMVGLVKNPAAQ